ncbi:MAG: methyltransferase [Desulfofustis sp.]|nr:methyltransferase [Desulfofustis sp.]
MSRNPHDQNDAADRAIREDTLFAGALSCRQYYRGYRFSVDSVLLGHFPLVRAGDSILDLGAGCGIIGLILLFRHLHRGISVTGIEQQEDLLKLAVQNRDDNGYHDRMHLIQGQVEQIDRFLAAESYSLVIANPPFYRPGSGRLCADRQTTTARHQRECGLQGFVDAAAYASKNRGRVVFVYPAQQTVELLVSLTARRLEPKRLQFVYSYPGATTPAKLVLVESVKNGGPGMNVMPPCFIYRRRNGAYSTSVQAMYQP